MSAKSLRGPASSPWQKIDREGSGDPARQSIGRRKRPSGYLRKQTLGMPARQLCVMKDMLAYHVKEGEVLLLLADIG
jgi:hypothetical protein